jgi:Uma2 family endonuclease
MTSRSGGQTKTREDEAMKSAMRRLSPSPPVTMPPLYNGDRLSQAEFHRRYEACPDDVKCELIGGTVYMPSPQRRPHGAYQQALNGVLFLYQAATPGVEGLDNSTTILGEESEPQPDLALRILPEYGGQSRTNVQDYVQGAPELVAEIAHSTEAIDLHEKKEDYERAGVREYLVLCLAEKELHWFRFRPQGRILCDKKGIYRSRVFPGLWIDGPALLALNARPLIQVINHGLASREHAAFVKRLRAAQK